MITKEQLLKGVTYREEFEITDIGKILIRPLSDWEASKIQAMMLQEIDIGGGIAPGEDLQAKITQALSGANFSKMISNSAEANWQICAWGIVDESGKPMFKADEVKQFPPGLPAKIADRIRLISGISEEEVLPFRG